MVPTPITMTPLSSVKGIPWGDAGAVGVQLTPDGQRFDLDATLVITPATPIPDDHTIAFGLEGEQHNLTLAEVDPKSKILTIVLHHFSSYGLSKGLLADTDAVAQRLGGSDEARIQSAVGTWLQHERQSQLLGQESNEFIENFTSWSKEYEEKVVNVRIAAAGESCAAGRVAIQTFLGFERQKQLLGFADEGAMAKMMPLFDTVSLKCMQEEYELCRDQHIIHRVVGVYFGFKRQSQLLGNEGGNAATEAKMADLVNKCLSFRVEFQSTGTFKDSNVTSIVSAKVKLKLDVDAGKITGSSALINTDFQMAIDGCSVTPKRGGGTMDVSGMSYKVLFSSPTDYVGHVEDISMAYYPGITSESATISCEGVTVPFPPSPIWTAIYIVAHYSEVDQTGAAGTAVKPEDIVAGLGGAGAGGGADLSSFGAKGAGFVASDWTILAKDLFATKEWIKDSADGVTEVGTLKLFHTPG
jgi:hypothetical protein